MHRAAKGRNMLTDCTMFIVLKVPGAQSPTSGRKAQVYASINRDLYLLTDSGEMFHLLRINFSLREEAMQTRVNLAKSFIVLRSNVLLSSLYEVLRLKLIIKHLSLAHQVLEPPNKEVWSTAKNLE